MHHSFCRACAACWQKIPAKRPTFAELVVQLSAPEAVPPPAPRPSQTESYPQPTEIQPAAVWWCISPASHLMSLTRACDHSGVWLPLRSTTYLWKFHRLRPPTAPQGTDTWSPCGPETPRTLTARRRNCDTSGCILLSVHACMLDRADIASHGSAMRGVAQCGEAQHSRRETVSPHHESEGERERASLRSSWRWPEATLRLPCCWSWCALPQPGLTFDPCQVALLRSVWGTQLRRPCILAVPLL